MAGHPLFRFSHPVMLFCQTLEGAKRQSCPGLGQCLIMVGWGQDSKAHWDWDNAWLWLGGGKIAKLAGTLIKLWSFVPPPPMINFGQVPKSVDTLGAPFQKWILREESKTAFTYPPSLLWRTPPRAGVPRLSWNLKSMKIVHFYGQHCLFTPSENGSKSKKKKIKEQARNIEEMFHSRFCFH